MMSLYNNKLSGSIPEGWALPNSLLVRPRLFRLSYARLDRKVNYERIHGQNLYHLVIQSPVWFRLDLQSRQPGWGEINSRVSGSCTCTYCVYI